MKTILQKRIGSKLVCNCMNFFKQKYIIPKLPDQTEPNLPIHAYQTKLTKESFQAKSTSSSEASTSEQSANQGLASLSLP